MSRARREADYQRNVPDPLNPIFLEMGMDLRVYLRLDLRAFLREHGLDPTSGEPSPDELQAILIERLRQYLRGQAYMVAADVNWIDDAIL